MRDFDIDHMRGCEVVDPNGEKIGVLRDILFDDRTATPAWLVIQYGVLRRMTLLPMRDVYTKAHGGVASTVDKDVVRHAPRVSGPAPSTTECALHYRTGS